jgi:hypothetical protein
MKYYFSLEVKENFILFGVARVCPGESGGRTKGMKIGAFCTLIREHWVDWRAMAVKIDHKALCQWKGTGDHAMGTGATKPTSSQCRHFVRH